MSFYKTFTTKDAVASISGSIRLVSKPLYILYSNFQCLNTLLLCVIHPYPHLKGRAFRIVFIKNLEWWNI